MYDQENKHTNSQTENKGLPLVLVIQILLFVSALGKL